MSTGWNVKSSSVVAITSGIFIKTVILRNARFATMLLHVLMASLNLQVLNVFFTIFYSTKFPTYTG